MSLCPGPPKWASTIKVKPILDFTEARDGEWQWHQLGHMQVCTSLRTDNHASTPPLSFLQAGCPSCRPTNSVKALKAIVCAESAVKPQTLLTICDLLCVKVQQFGGRVSDDVPLWRCQISLPRLYSDCCWCYSIRRHQLFHIWNTKKSLHRFSYLAASVLALLPYWLCCYTSVVPATGVLRDKAHTCTKLVLTVMLRFLNFRWRADTADLEKKNHGYSFGFSDELGVGRSHRMRRRSSLTSHQVTAFAHS